MRKLLFVMMIAILPMVAEAQRVDKPGEPYDFYCVVKYYVGYCRIDYKKGDNFSREIRNENGKRKTFNSESEVINYMTKRGWTYVEYIGDNKFLFKKAVKTDEEAIISFEFENKKSGD